MSQDQVARLEVAYEDGISAAAAAGARALERVGAAAEVTETKVTRAGASAQTLKNRLDPVSAATRDLATAMRRAAEAQETLAADMTRGTTSAAEFARAMATAEARVEAARLKLAAAKAQVAELGGAHASAAAGAGKFADQADAAAAATARHSAQMKALVPQIQDVIASVGSGAPALQILAQQGGQITSIFGGTRATLAVLSAAVGGPLVLAVGAGAVALGALGLAADRGAAQMATLQNQLRATRSDYTAMAAEAEAAAKRVAATSGANLADARAGAQVIASVPTFSGDRAALEAYLRTARDLAAVMGKELPDAARDLAAAMRDPGAEAEKLAKSDFPGMSSALAYSIKLMADGGDKAGAFARYLDAVRAGTKGAAENASPLRQELEKLKVALADPKGAVGGFFEAAGKAVEGIATQTVREIRGIVAGVEWAAEKLGKLLPGFGSDSKPSGSGSGPPLLGSDVSGAGSAYRVAPATGRDATGAMQDASRDIYRIAEARNFAGDLDLSALQADFATRVALQESGGHQFGKGGAVLTSPAGAMGRMQLMPGTARGLGVDATTTEGNTEGGLKYIAQLWRQFGGDPILVAMAYNWGPGNVQKFLAAKGALAVPAETRGYVENVTGFDPAGLSERYGGGVAVPGATASGETRVSPMTGSPGTSRSGGAGFDLARSMDGLAFQRDRNSAQQQLLQADLAAAVPGSAEAEKLAEALARVRREAIDLIPEQEKLARAAQDAVVPYQAQAGAARELAKIEQQFHDVTRAGVEMDRAALDDAKAGKLAELAAQHRDVVTEMERETQAQTALAAAYDSGARGVIEATNRQQALADARKYFIEGTEQFDAAVGREVDALNRRSAAVAGNATRELGFTQKSQLEQIELETKLVSASADVREREIALLRERQRLIAAGGPDAVNTDYGKASLENVAKIADATAALQRQRDAYTELSEFGARAFETIGNAITTAFANGGLKALDFKGLMKSVISSIIQEFLKLAVLNPLLNGLFGGGRNTLGGVLGAGLSALAGASGGASGAGAGDAVSGVAGAVSAAAGGGKSTSITDAAGYLGTAYRAANWLTNGGLSSTVSGWVSSGINAVGGWFGTTAGATNLALANAGTGVYGVATAGQLATANIQLATNAITGATEAAGAAAAGATAAAEGVTAATGTLGAAASSVMQALPYVGIAVGVVTALATGNYKGAALMAGGAVIGGTIGSIIPGIGTAVGAAVGAVIGGLVDMFSSGPKKNAYLTVGVEAQDGKIARGETHQQLMKKGAVSANAAVDAWALAVNGYMEKVGVKLDMPDGRFGGVGRNVKGFEQVENPIELFKALRFTSTETGTNFGRAKAGAFKGQQFETIEAFNEELLRVATFADNMDRIGATIEKVGPKLTGIRLSAVRGNFTQDSKKDPVAHQAERDLVTALDHAVTNRDFADVKALEEAMQTVANWVGGTMPAMIAATGDATSDFQNSIAELQKTYGEAIKQASDYGLATDKLAEAQARIQKKWTEQAAKVLDQNLYGISARRLAAQGDTRTAELMNFDTSAEQQRDALSKQITDIWGMGYKTAEDYARRMKEMEETLSAERLAIVQKYARAQADAIAALDPKMASYWSRLAVAEGDGETADLINHDTAATKERAELSATLAGIYGEWFKGTQDYADRMALLERTLGAERVAIVKKYAAQETAAAEAAAKAQADARKQAQAGLTSVFRGLETYAHTLQTSGASPLSPAAQYELATRRFRAVAGAAAAGDYNSLGRLQGYADAYLTASRDVNGSGSAYAADFASVLDALGSAAAAPVDTLTASAMAELAREQTDTLVDALAAVQAEVAALRREVAQGSMRPARAA